MHNVILGLRSPGPVVLWCEAPRSPQRNVVHVLRDETQRPHTDGVSDLQAQRLMSRAVVPGFGWS